MHLRQEGWRGWQRRGAALQHSAEPRHYWWPRPCRGPRQARDRSTGRAPPALSMRHNRTPLDGPATLQPHARPVAPTSPNTNDLRTIRSRGMLTYDHLCFGIDAAESCNSSGRSRSVGRSIRSARTASRSGFCPAGYRSRSGLARSTVTPPTPSARQSTAATYMVRVGQHA